MEIWKDIPQYEGLYQASSLGRIRTCEGKVTSNARYRNRIWASRIMKGRGNSIRTGKRVSLWKDGKAKDYLVARLVALTFLGVPPEDYTVNHKDGNRMNNAIENLEWLSREDNIRHAFATGLMDSFQKSILITDTVSGNEHHFCSLAECSRFLERNPGYISGSLKKGRTVVSNSKGHTFQIHSVLTR